MSLELNTFINRFVAYRADTQDYWQSLGETMSKRTGDCEDKSIAKFFALEMLDSPTYDGMKLVYCLDDGKAHMVLLANGLVYDNTTDLLLPPPQRPSLEPVYAFNRKSMYLVDMAGWTLSPSGGANRLSKWVKCVRRQDEYSTLARNLI